MGLPHNQHVAFSGHLALVESQDTRNAGDHRSVAAPHRLAQCVVQRKTCAIQVAARRDNVRDLRGTIRPQRFCYARAGLLVRGESVNRPRVPVGEVRKTCPEFLSPSRRPGQLNPPFLLLCRDERAEARKMIHVFVNWTARHGNARTFRSPPHKPRLPSPVGTGPEH